MNELQLGIRLNELESKNERLEEELLIRIKNIEEKVESLHKKLDKGVTVSVAKIRPEDLLGVPLVGGK